MKLIEDLGCDHSGKWRIHYGIFECPFCQSPFKADHADIKRGRKKHCGCKGKNHPCPEQVGETIIKADLGLINGRKHVAYKCDQCDNEIKGTLTNIKSGKHKKNCGCAPIPEKPHKAVNVAPACKKIKKPTEIESVAFMLGITIEESTKMMYNRGSAMQRCDRPTHPKYPRYGGRGITMCKEWRESFIKFAIDMGPKPSPDMSLDRINNSGNYEPGNCRWATARQQQNNKG